MTTTTVAQFDHEPITHPLAAALNAKIDRAHRLGDDGLTNRLLRLKDILVRRLHARDRQRG